MGKRGDVLKNILCSKRPRNGNVSAGILFMAAPGGISTTLTPSLEPHFTFISGLNNEHRWRHCRFSNLVYSRFYYHV
ncbi:MAG TPA: hypothetical protein VJI32_05265, partial [Candidatus Nanoarchaeia archaeon]|nr:hypothetical protein [Candidatus Nanoarchaeia archaeon]